MKILFVAVLSSCVMIGNGQPVKDESAIPIDVSSALVKEMQPIDDGSAFADMEGSESSLKVIENKLEHWLKKYYKKTDKMNNNNGFAGYPQTGFPMIGYPSFPLMSYPLTGYGYGGLGGLNGLGLGGGFTPGLGGFGTGLGLGGYGLGTGLGGYGYGTGGYGSLGGFGYGR